MIEERKKILELVQEGRLSAQEAIILIEALEEKPLKEPMKNADQPTSDYAEKTNASSDGQTDEKKQDDSFYSQLENAGERIFDFVNNALNKIKHIDWQFNQSVDIPHTFEQIATDVEKVDIDIANGPVRISTWDQEEVRIECQAKVYRSEDREDARKYFLENTIFSINNGLLCFATQSKWMRVETVIYVPKKQYNKLSIRIFNGGLTGENIESDFLSVKTTNGKMELSQFVGDKFHVETVNGQIVLKESKAAQLDAETVNGTIDVMGSYQNVELQSFNGNISCLLSELGTKTIHAKAVTGNIQLYLPETATVDGDVRSNLGSYKLELDGINVIHEKKEMIQKQVTFKRTGSDEHTIHVLADTKTGSVHVKQAPSSGE